MLNFIRRTPNLLNIIILGVVLAVVPWRLENNYVLTVMTLIGEFTMLTVGLSLLMGYAGQISLGQATFFGIGAYVMAITSTRFNISPWIALLLGVVVAAAVAFLIGTVIFRLRGHYLAMATLGMNVIFFLILTQEVEWTGGPSGFRGVPELNIGSFVLHTDAHYYYLVWFFALIVIALSLNIVNSRVGRAMRALHTSEIAAETLGVDTNMFKLQVFALSAAFSSLAGGLHAAYLGFISPSSFTIGVSIELVVMAVVGGLASVWGALFGAAAVLVLEQWLRTWVKMLIPKASGEHEIIAFGFILVLIMMFLPEGLVTGVVNVIKNRLKNRQRKKIEASAAGD